MLDKIIVTEDKSENRWFISFDGLPTTKDSIEIDEDTAQELLNIKSDT